MVTRKLMIKVLLMNLSIKNGGYAVLIRLDLMFSVFMKRVPIVTNFKQTIYQTLN